MTRLARCLAALLAVTGLAAAAAAGAGGGPLVVALQLPGTTVRVVDTSGRQTGVFKLRQEPQYVGPTSYPGRALVAAQGGGVSLLDARALKTIPVHAGQVVPEPQFTGGRRYVVLGGTDSVATALLDLSTGKASDLSRLGGVKPMLGGGIFSPDGGTLLGIGANATWLVPCANPAKAVALPSGWTGGSFSPDGKTVVFVDFRDRKHPKLALVDADGGNRHEVDPHVPGLSLAQFLPDGRLLLAGPSVFVAKTDGSDRTQLGKLGPGLPFRVAVDPGGRGVLVGAISPGSNDADRWTWFGLHGGSHLVAALNRLTRLPSASPGRYAYFVDNPQQGTSGGGTFAVVDLQTGQAHVALRLPRSESYFGTVVAPRGRGIAVTSLAGNTSRIQLVTPSGTPRLLASGAVTTAQFSPDGSWVAVSARPAGRKPGKLQLVPVGGGKTVDAGIGDAPVWVS